jgi:hypothetical protein
MKHPKRRNLLVLHPLMKKGGVHQKTRKAERQALKQATRELVAEARLRD